MKRFLLFAIMAMLIGVFTSNANAQVVRKANREARRAAVSTRTAVPKTQVGTVKEDWNSKIKEYEYAVDDAVKMYKSMNVKGVKVDPKEFDQCLNKALDLKAQITKVKDKLNRSQIRRFNKATTKLNQILTKG